jgi:hypothetical protein
MCTGLPLWAGSDQVHLTPEGYRDLALVIADNIQAGEEGDTGSASLSGRNGQKRRLPESVVTRPPSPLPKHGRGAMPIRVASWLHGKMEGGGRASGHSRIFRTQ